MNAEGTTISPAGSVTINEGTYTAILMDADGLGRTVLTYDPQSNSLDGVWQKLAQDGVTWWVNYETWKSVMTCIAEPFKHGLYPHKIITITLKCAVALDHAHSLG